MHPILDEHFLREQFAEISARLYTVRAVLLPQTDGSETLDPGKPLRLYPTPS